MAEKKVIHGMETCSLHTVQVLTDGRQLSFDQNHILEHTLDSIIHPFLLFYAHTLDLVLCTFSILPVVKVISVVYLPSFISFQQTCEIFR